MGVASVAPMLRQLGDALIVRIVQVSAKYRLEDFAKRTFDIAAHLQTIENTVEKSIEKHKTNKDAKGDGMAYTAAAAEVYLGWVHPGGERHITKVADGVISLERELQELDKLHKNGIDMSGERYYVRGRNVLELCKRAQQDPSGFLWERGYAVIKDFVDDMQANGVDGNVRVVDDVRRRLGMAPLRRKA
jgi:hypothetical protein